MNVISLTLLAALFTSTAADQQSVNLTVYNAELALVHDRRSVVLSAGENQIAWRDVSASMDPVTAILDPVDPSVHLLVREQNFDYDVLGQSSLLRAYVGKYVTIVHPAQFTGERTFRERAKILSVDDGVVLQYRDRIETGLGDGYIEFPGIPSNLLDEPTLTLDVDSEDSGRQTLDLQYLTSGLSWHADYIGTLDADETRMDLAGLVTLDNQSGTAYHNARLQLVAGNVNVPPSPRALTTIARVASSTYGANPNVSQESYLEYHLYTMGRPTTILNKQTKQLTLLAAKDIPVVKTLELRGQPEYYEGQSTDLGTRIPVGVYLSFVNRGGELGIPLPGGTVRVYQNDSHGLSQFAGSDSIPHTPRGDTVRLHLGDSFDVVANKRQTNFELPGDCHSISSYAITILNGKKVPQDVLVVEPIPGDWSITAENMPHQKSSASTATWLVHAAKDGKTVLTYTADVKWCL